jgi:23S rRNA pseudouridine2605 synthase
MERLNKYLAHAGVGSRRHCDTLIAAGRVKVDGVPVTDLGLKIDPEAHKVSVDDHPVRSEKAVYWAVNKPVGYLSTNSDPDGRPLAVDLLPHVEQRVYTVGRLDEASEGLLLMTNDGELAFHLMHPRYGIPKTYLVLVAGKPGPADLQRLLDGVWLSDGKVKAKAVRRLKPQGNSTWLRVVLTEGKNREIRRMLAQLGHKVMKLRRVAIGPVTLDKLPKGKARRVSEPELKELREWVTTAQEKIAKARDRAAGPQANDRSEPAAPSSNGRRQPAGPPDRKTGPRPQSSGPPRNRRPGARFK